jgi:DNA-directed RNA polymerase subunit E'/Rpb7
MSNQVTDIGECFQSVDVNLKVAIQPVYSAEPIDAVKQQLNNLLFKYSESIGGVPLSFSELSFPKGKEYARIMSDQFWLHVDVCTKLVVFKPRVGQKIQGKINKVGGCLQVSF